MIRKCQTCKNNFEASRKTARFCSVRCYRRSPSYKAYQKEYDSSPSKMKYWRSEAGRLSWRRNASKKQVIVALERLGFAPQSSNITELYQQLVDAVSAREDRAKKILKGGKPDACDGLVEFKFGIDFLRADQLISDILRGSTTKVRWLKSWDALEWILSGNPNISILFPSYFKFLLWCQNATKL